MGQRKPFSGSARKLVLGIDIGTTYAGMSYCLLEPNRIPEILPVTRFPAQDHVGGDSKVPSVVYYDRSGRVRACGAEALQESVVEQAGQERWEKAEWFKLHLRPSTSVSVLPLSLPPLPRNKGHQRIRFVTEGEASLHFCIMNGLATDPLRLGNGVVIIDAGGGTVDISAYRKLTTPKGETFEEIAPPQCLFVGSVWVSTRAGEHLRTKLRGSRYAGDVEHIRDCFDKTTKLRFRRSNDLQYIKFGRPGDNSEALNITSGQLKLEGEIVATFFKPSLDAILRAMTNLSALSPVSSVLLVGGFGASDWLYSELKSHLIFQGLDVSRPDSHVNKAVADGAVSFYLDHFVSVRVSKHTYGIESSTAYIHRDAEHCARVKSAVRDAAGDLILPNLFSAILHKNTRVSETREYRKSYRMLRNNTSELRAVEIPIRCYQGQSQTPSWMDVEPEQYRVLCTVHADTSKIAKTLQRKMGLNGVYYGLEIDVVLSFGLTELKAQIAWIENGVEKRGPAKLVYEEVDV
ncbi:hypothetical protein MVEN_00626700 [Mycena venus]|uniref:Actin-like ATPase domain-containing protein n=1 Tax=Mycena venus TaxID=2733690 RepID=A0A8H7D625_9AGAR|nr:hypothetical protein MVEN_00626700 [Mycena venus]